MNEWTIRRARRNDLNDIVRSYRKLFLFEKRQFDKTLDADWPMSRAGRAHLRGFIGTRSSIALVVEANGRLIGFLLGSSSQEARRVKALYGQLDSMFLESAWRGQGIGRQLVEEFLLWCKRRRVRSIAVIAATQNKDALGLYRHFGFEPSYTALERKG